MQRFASVGLAGQHDLAGHQREDGGIAKEMRGENRLSGIDGPDALTN